MMSTAIRRLHPSRRWPRFMVLDWAFELPYVSHSVRKVGGVPANPFNAQRLLEQDELVMAFPEGAKGSGKPYSERYRLQRFGRGGFVEIALRSRRADHPGRRGGLRGDLPEDRPRAGAGELRRSVLRRCPPLADRVLPPVDLSDHPPDAAEDRALILDVSAQVRETIQRAIRENLVERGGAFV